MRRIAIVVVCLSAAAWAQSTYSGGAIWYGGASYGAEEGYGFGPPFAAAPTVWVNNHQCDHTFTGGDTDHLLSPATVAQLQTEYNTWVAAGDVWWRVRVPHGAVLNSSSYNSDGALLSFSGKTGTVTKCFVVESDTPLPSGQTACSHGLPGFGGTRNPGCDGHVGGGTSNDVASMWTLRLDAPGHWPQSPRGIYFAGGYGSNPGNHIVLRDMELTVNPGAMQSLPNNNAPALIVAVGDNYSRPHELGFERDYLHGWDPEPVGAGTRGWDHQPTGTGPGGADYCAEWVMSGQVTTNGTAVTWSNTPHSSSGNKNSFGATFANGTTITINGTNYTIAAVDPTTSDTILSLTTSAGTNSTAVDYSYVNPPSQWAVGCGDDIGNGIKLQADDSWIMWTYLEKLHQSSTETQGITFGFASGPGKINENWIEGASEAIFSGGGAVDARGGPEYNVEIRRNYMGIDLNYRMLTTASNSGPKPPFGCAALSSNSSKKNCPFQWVRKNAFELKLCVQCIVDGNIIEGSWADGQDGKVILQTVRTCSGGASCGIFDLNRSSPTYGQPISAVHDVRMSNNWIRNSAQGVGAGPRSGPPGNGGGVSMPTGHFDYINNLFSNIGDVNQFGMNNANLFESWGSDGQTYPCAMSRSEDTAHASCAVGSISSLDGGIGALAAVWATNGLVTVSFGASSRQDPLTGGTAYIHGASTAGYNGVFTVVNVTNGGNPSAPGSSTP